jgi:hypothetical protein
LSTFLMGIVLGLHESASASVFVKPTAASEVG